MPTSDTTEGAKPLKTERRDDVSGGLDTRSSVATSPPNKVIAIGNFRLTKDGSLTLRLGGQQLAKVNPFPNTTFLPAPIVTDGGVGTLAAGTYTISYALGSVSDASGPIGGSPPGIPLVLGANRQIKIVIPSVNSGNGIGQDVNAFDDPANSGYLFAGTNFNIFASKDADPNLTKQLGVTAALPTVGTTPTGQTVTMTSYSNNLAVAPVNQQVPIPIRHLFWHSLADVTVGVIGARAFAMSGAYAAATYLLQATDQAGKAFGFSRLPTRIASTIIDAIAIFSDGVGKPKKLNTPQAATTGKPLADPSLWSFFQLGANAPLAAPTLAIIAGTGQTGAFFYIVTFTYRTQRQDGSFILSESNSSPMSASSGALANQKIRVTITAPLEDPVVAGVGNIISWNVYRTAAGGAIFNLLASVAISNLTFDDGQADSKLLSQQPPDAGLQDPNDPPPAGLGMVTEHAGRGFGVVSVANTTRINGTSIGQIIRIRYTNVLQFSKLRVKTGVAISALILMAMPDLGNLDAWPSKFAVTCGKFSPITGIKSFRGVLYVFKEDEIGVIEGQDQGSFAYRTIWSGSGAMENSVIECGNVLLAFDQAMGPVAINGYNVQDLGYDTIQQDWLAPVATTAGEAVSGGGRGGAGIISAKWDIVMSEARWVVSDLQTDPNSAYAQGATPTYFEYVCQMPRGKPSGEFTRFTGARTGGVVTDRRIGTMDVAIVGQAQIAFRARDMIYGDYHGRVVLDNKVANDLDGVTATPISLRATWPFFFGDNLEMVKLFKFFFMLFQMGATAGDVMTVQARSLSKGSANQVTMATFNGAAATAGLDQMKRIGVPAPFDGTNIAERGIAVDIFGSASSATLNISELSLKYQDVDETRDKP